MKFNRIILLTLTLIILGSIACGFTYPKKTSEVTSGNSGVLFLANEAIKVQCGPKQVLAGFHLKRHPAGKKMFYEYRCVTNKGITEKVTQHSTDLNSSGKPGKATEFLDRHKLQCPGEYGIQSFILKKNADESKISYDYTCVQITTRSCVEKETGKTGTNDSEVVYLDRQEVNAEDGEYLSGFGMMVYNGKDYYYKYNTCSIKNPPAPVPKLILDNELRTRNSDNIVSISKRRLR